MANLINCFISAPFTTQEVEGDSISNNQLENQVYEGTTLNEGQYKFLITPEPFYVVDTTNFTINNITGLAAGTNNTILWSDAITGGGNGSFTSTDIAGITLSNTGTGGELLNTILVTVTLKPTFVMPSADKTILLNIAGTAPAYVPTVVPEEPEEVVPDSIPLFDPKNIWVSFTMMNNDPLVKIAPPTYRGTTGVAPATGGRFWPNYPPLLGQVPTVEQLLGGNVSGNYGPFWGTSDLYEIWPNCGADINECGDIDGSGEIDGALKNNGNESSYAATGSSTYQGGDFGGWTAAYTGSNASVDDATPELIYTNVIPPRCGGSYQFDVGGENQNLIGSTIGSICGVSIASGMNWHVKSTTINGNYDQSAGGIGAVGQFINVYSSVTSYRDANNNLVHIPWTSSNNLSAVDLNNVVLTQLDCWTVNVFIPWNNNFIFPNVGALPIHECSSSSIMVKNLFTCFVGDMQESYGCVYPTGNWAINQSPANLNYLYPAGAYNFNSFGNAYDANDSYSVTYHNKTPAPSVPHPSC